MMDAASPGRCGGRFVEQIRGMIDHNALKCQYGLKPEINMARMERLVTTMFARRALSIMCFDGGNKPHVDEAYANLKPIKDCHGILTKAPPPPGGWSK